MKNSKPQNLEPLRSALESAATPTLSTQKLGICAAIFSPEFHGQSLWDHGMFFNDTVCGLVVIGQYSAWHWKPTFIDVKTINEIL